MASEREPARSTTPRGFTIYDKFTDTRGLEVRVQESSSALEDCVWVFCAPDTVTEGIAPHLTVEQAEWLRDALDAFIREHGGGEPGA